VLAAYCFLSGGVWAGTIKLKANQTLVEMRCMVNTDGKGVLTSGKGAGGYGCKTAKGEVSCTAEGDCTGTCQGCGSKVVVSPNVTVPFAEILGSKTVGRERAP
jgi:hypothetical protein